MAPSSSSALTPPDWDLGPGELRRLGDRLVAVMGEIFAEGVRDPILAKASGAAVRALFDQPAPATPTPLDELMGPWLDKVRRHNRRNGHPRFFGYVCSPADPAGIFADALVSAMDQIPTAWRSAPAAAEIERLVVRWFDDLLGFGAMTGDATDAAPGGEGLLTSGGSAANLHALLCALVRTEPEPGERGDLVVYLPEEAHASLDKAARVLGVRPRNLRKLPVDERFRLRVAALDAAIAADRAAGLLPACVCVSAGTTNTGAIDPIEEAADVCRRHGVWLHVDGAYGAPAALAPSYSYLRRGFAHADSLSLDPHKWLFAPFDVGCVLVRDAAAMRQAFSISGAYLEVQQTDAIEGHAFFEHGLELSRRFRALKVWWILMARGTDALGAEIERHCALRRYLDRRIDEHPELEGMGSGLSISCFRYLPAGEPDDDAIDRCNRELLAAMVAEGRIYMSPTVLRGRTCLRAAILNYRTRVEDIDLLVEEVVRHGQSACRS